MLLRLVQKPHIVRIVVTSSVVDRLHSKKSDKSRYYDIL